MSNDTKIESVSVGDTIYTFKEPVEESVAVKLKNELEDAANLGGEYNIATTLGEGVTISDITFNKDKVDVTPLDKNLINLKSENDNLKSQLSDVVTRLDEVNTMMTELQKPAPVVTPEPEPVPAPAPNVPAPEPIVVPEPIVDPEPAKPPINTDPAATEE